MRFVGADRVKAARLSTLRGEFDRMYMAEGEQLDDYAGKISGMAARYASLGSTLDDTAMVKKLLDTVPDRLYSAVAGIALDINLRPTILVTHIFGGYSHRERYSRTRYRFCRLS